MWRMEDLVPSIVILLLVFPSTLFGLAIDNEVVEIPRIDCSETSITFSVRTRDVFRGNIYIKGQFGVPQCRQEYTGNDYNGASYSVRIADCGMRRIRQLQPHGMNYMLIFVANFHPQFVTKIDRAYNVRCFYAQTDKSVSQELAISMIPTQTLEQSTILMPNCVYSIRSGTVNGPKVRYTRVGDQLVHRWECDNPNFGMLVKNCFVNDGGDSSVRVLDARGCPVFTPVIQGNLQYDTSLNLAYVPIWAYKFPDRSQLYFQCQIQICNKRDNECTGVTPPNCPLIAKADYSPSSQLNPNVIPNQVIGSFNPYASKPIQNQGDIFQPPVNPIIGSPDNGYSGIELPYAAGQQFYNQQGGGVSFQQPNSGVYLSPSSRPRHSRSRAESAPIELPASSEFLRATSRILQPTGDEVEDGQHETMDVIAEPVFVTDPNLDEPQDADFPLPSYGSRSREDPISESGHSLCFNRLALSILLFTFVLMSASICSLVFYIFTANRRSNCEKKPRNQPTFLRPLPGKEPGRKKTGETNC